MPTTKTATATKKSTAVKVKAVKTVEQPQIPDWEVMLSVINPDQSRPRPRRTSLHTLAYVLGRKDPLALAKEMEASGKVLGYVCPDVKTPIFYLEKMVGLPTMIDTRDAKVWGTWRYPTAGAASLQEFMEKNPFPQVKGFKRFGNGNMGVGSPNAMPVPYEPADYPYARLIIKALTEAGYTPGLTEDDLIETK